jgi:hypothetical protein
VEKKVTTIPLVTASEEGQCARLKSFFRMNCSVWFCAEEIERRNNLGKE